MRSDVSLLALRLIETDAMWATAQAGMGTYSHRAAQK